MKIQAEIRNADKFEYINIELPTSNSHIDDVLERLNSDGTVTVRGRFELEYIRNQPNIDIENCNIYELNYLAEKIDKFNYDSEQCFLGAYYIQSENMTLPKAINLAMNIEQNKAINFQPARDQIDLAEFYLENGLIAEIQDVTDETYQWILAHTNLDELGEEIRQKENGTFIGDGYVTVGEIEDIYDGSLTMPITEKYVFKLEIGFNPQEYDGSIYTLPLPVPDSAIELMKTEMQVKHLSELTCYDFKSIVPLLEPMDFNMNDIYTLNQLATSIQHFKETNKLITYKAMVDTLEIIDLKSVTQLCDYVDDFELKQNTRSFSDFGKIKFENTVPDELLECLNTYEYGKKIAEKDGVSMTSYGALIPKDGVPLLDRFYNMNETMTPTMKKV